MQEAIITILTDFGEKDPYVGAMKGVILSICPHAKIIDLSHNIQKHNIREGAFFLFSVAKYYPKNTIHLVVIDPGVGSDRKPLIIQSKNFIFVGPDNGVLSIAASEDEIQKIVTITNSSYFLKPISNTFHGRDIFAPVAAHLANNEPIERFGHITKDWIQLKLPKVQVKDNMINAEIIHIDRFGNIITNIPKKLLQNRPEFRKGILEIKIKDKELKIPLCSSYNQVKQGEFLGIIGSTNYLEISKNQESAANALDVQIQEKIFVKLS